MTPGAWKAIHLHGQPPSMSYRGSTTVYVGNLPGDTRKRDVEDVFYKYGKIIEIDIKIPPRPPGFAFIEFGVRIFFKLIGSLHVIEYRLFLKFICILLLKYRTLVMQRTQFADVTDTT
mmetsp:Transcript_27362/g.37744  ORF Transcript_27362/g.37744 Transcript_27362/m.37744 type:complete len:118 (+) Transcript_27362:110-463(+)